MSSLIDLLGRRFGSLVVIRRGPNAPTGKARWECKCDCGNTAFKYSDKLRIRRVKSCGCRSYEGITNPDAAIVHALGEYRRGATKRGLSFRLTFEEFASLVSKNCFYCGQPPSMTTKRVVVQKKYGGVDRIDSREGYTPDNCLPCCTKCNKAKSDYTTEEFLAWVNQIAAHQAAAYQAVHNVGVH